MSWRLMRAACGASRSGDSILGDEELLDRWRSGDPPERDRCLSVLLGSRHGGMLSRLAWHQHASGPSFHLEDCESYAVLFALCAYSSYVPELGSTLGAHVYVRVARGLVSQRVRGVEDGPVALPRRARRLRALLDGYYDADSVRRDSVAYDVLGCVPSQDEVLRLRASYGWLMLPPVSLSVVSVHESLMMSGAAPHSSLEDDILTSVAVEQALEGVPDGDVALFAEVVLRGSPVRTAAESAGISELDAMRVVKNLLARVRSHVDVQVCA